MNKKFYIVVPTEDGINGAMEKSLVSEEYDDLDEAEAVANESTVSCLRSEDLYNHASQAVYECTLVGVTKPKQPSSSFVKDK